MRYGVVVIENGILKNKPVHYITHRKFIKTFPFDVLTEVKKSQVQLSSHTLEAEKLKVFQFGYLVINLIN